MTRMNLLQKIIYYYLELQEKRLSKKLSKHFATSSSNITSKTVVSGAATMTLSAETEKNVQLTRKNVEDIVKSCNNNPEKLLEYIQLKGTKVCRIDNADKILRVIKEEEGLITPITGIEGLYVNIISRNGFSLTSKPVFILRNGEIDPYFMAHQFYKWYALQMKLPGFDSLSQKIFKISLNSDGSIISQLNLDEMTGLKEAINRDKEATDFALFIAKQKEGTKNVLNKIKNEGGASI